jgi:hypothetical protein
MTLTKKDRDFIQKIAKGLGDLQKEVAALREQPSLTSREPLQTMRTAGVGTPACTVVSRFAIKDVNTVSEQTVAQRELRSLISEFCKEAGIKELSIVYQDV